LYQEFLDSFKDLDTPEEFRKEAIDPSKKVDDRWEFGIDGGLSIDEYLEVYLESNFNEPPLLWEIMKQVVDDLLEPHFEKPLCVAFHVIPRLKRYPLIQQYNFEYPEHQKTYAQMVFKCLKLIQNNVFDFISLETFENGEIKFFLSDVAEQRLKTLKKIIEDLEEYFKHSKEEGIAYELSYKPSGEIRIRGAKEKICKPDDNSPAQQLFNYLYENPDREITNKETRDNKLEITRPFNDLIKDLYLVSEYGKLFVPKKGKDFAILKTKITYQDLKDAGLEKISPDELVTKLKKKSVGK
ncbi:MAG: hypothetical protein OEL89_05060, partial [Candidatus Peregrinibacteria bacterium]|nr:hypothetical protein [Candidatus Peregrinibacteria bacterium]